MMVGFYHGSSPVSRSPTLGVGGLELRSRPCAFVEVWGNALIPCHVCDSSRHLDEIGLVLVVVTASRNSQGKFSSETNLKHHVIKHRKVNGRKVIVKMKRSGANSLQDSINVESRSCGIGWNQFFPFLPSRQKVEMLSRTTPYPSFSCSDLDTRWIVGQGRCVRFYVAY